MGQSRNGVLKVASDDSVATGYGLADSQERPDLYRSQVRWSMKAMIIGPVHLRERDNPRSVSR